MPKSKKPISTKPTKKSEPIKGTSIPLGLSKQKSKNQPAAPKQIRKRPLGDVTF